MIISFSKLYNKSRDTVDYMIREITHICRNLPKRAPGTPGEKEAAEYLAGKLKDECGCSEVNTETFTVRPAAFYGYFYITAGLGVLTAALFFVTPVLSIIIGVLDLLLFIFQFGLYKELIDPIFPKKTSVNVTGVRKCSGECRRRIFICGHIDAPWEFTLNYHFGGVVFETPGAASVLGVLFYIAISIAALTGAAWTHTAALIGLVFIPFFILVGFTYNTNVVSDGANDNLTGCMMGVSLLREMEALGIDAENTEIGVILTGSEEAGLKGAAAWSSKHRGEFDDVPTYILCFDTIHDPKYFMANAKDLNGLLKTDQELCSAFLEAAEDASVPCKKGWVPPFGGSTDCTAFLRGGFRAISVTGLNHALEDYYHTRKDSYDNMNPEGMENCYRALVRFIELADNNKLGI